MKTEISVATQEILLGVVDCMNPDFFGSPHMLDDFAMQCGLAFSGDLSSRTITQIASEGKTIYGYDASAVLAFQTQQHLFGGCVVSAIGTERQQNHDAPNACHVSLNISSLFKVPTGYIDTNNTTNNTSETSPDYRPKLVPALIGEIYFSTTKLLGQQQADTVYGSDFVISSFGIGLQPANRQLEDYYSSLGFGVVNPDSRYMVLQSPDQLLDCYFSNIP